MWFVGEYYMVYGYISCMFWNSDRYRFIFGGLF